MNIIGVDRYQQEALEMFADGEEELQTQAEVTEQAVQQPSLVEPAIQK